MSTEQSLVATALHAWTMQIARAEKVFLGRTDVELRQEVAPGKNRLVYLWGHLIAVHDAMLPLLGIGDRLHPELDAPFLEEADGTTGDLPSAAQLAKYLGRREHGADRRLRAVVTGRLDATPHRDDRCRLRRQPAA